MQTVYRAGRVEGVLRLDVPTVNLGYDQIQSGGAGIDPTEEGSVTEGEALSRGVGGDETATYLFCFPYRTRVDR